MKDATGTVSMRMKSNACFLFLVPTVCQILPKGVVGVLGPSSSPASSSIISNICGEKEVSGNVPCRSKSVPLRRLTWPQHPGGRRLPRAGRVMREPGLLPPGVSCQVWGENGVTCCGQGALQRS